MLFYILTILSLNLLSFSQNIFPQPEHLGLLTNETLSKIPEVTDYNFQETVNKQEYTFIYFHSSWCKICKALNSEINVAAKHLYELSPPRIIASVNVDSNDTLSIQKKITLNNLPALLLYSKTRNKYLPYTGLFNARSIITFILKNTGKDVNDILNKDHIESLINDNTTYMTVLLFNKTHEATLKKVARTIPFSLFGNCFSNECKHYFQSRSDIVILKQFENDIKHQRFYLNIQDEHQLKRMIYLNSLPLIGEFSQFASDILFQNNINILCYIKRINETETKTKTIRDIVDTILIKNREENDSYDGAHRAIVTNAFIFDTNGNEPDNHDYNIISFFGIEPRDLYRTNILLIIDFSDRGKFKVYRLKEDITNDSILTFVNNYKLGNLRAEPRSESTPQTQPSKNLHVVVGKTFNKEVLDNNRQVVWVAFITLNCEKCFEIQNIFAAWSDKFRANDRILFAFVDPVSNEIEGMEDYFDNTKFEPKIRYYHKNKEKGFIEVKGELDEEKIENWVIEQGELEEDIEGTSDL